MIVSNLDKNDKMSEYRAELNQKITTGKRAFIKNNLDLAILSFQDALDISNNASPPLNSIIGISKAFLALIDAHKGKKDDILEKIYSAIDYFPENPSKPLAYVSILTDIGLEFQKISLFECSIIILKRSLDLAKKQNSKDNLETISTVSRILAYSYYQVGNSASAAKLFRIAADLTDNPMVAIDLYRNSAYLYYKGDRKEDALNILETAFDKSGIIQDTKTQAEIARFQGTISYELYKDFSQSRYLDYSLDYLELAYKKFECIKDELWLIKILYEKAMFFDSMNKIWQRNKILRRISQYRLTNENEEFVIKAILLLTVHELEGENYSQAEYYLRQIPTTKYEQMNKPLSDKIHELLRILDNSYKRTQLHSNLKFSRGELDLPVEELVSDNQDVLESEIGKKIPIKVITPRTESTIKDSISKIDPSSEIERPIQDLVSEIKSSSTNLATLHREYLELEQQGTEISDPIVSLALKAPSIEVLKELFDESEDSKVQIPDHDPLQQVQQNEILQDTSQDETRVDQFIPEEIQNTENNIALERLFTAHQLSRQETKMISVMENEKEELSSEESYRSPTSSSQIESDPSMVSRQLQKAGWAVQMNFTSSTRRGAEPDIIAEKGLIRKNRKLIFFAENPTDAEICSFLLQTNIESGEKVIYLLRGNPHEVNISPGIKIVTQIDQLF